MKKPVTIDDKIYLIDDFDLGLPGRTGTYLLLEEDLTIIETCTAKSVPRILDGLRAIGCSPENVKYIILTHIHLDHAGGAGLLLQHCPSAKVVVHPKGARHLADPSRLIAGAKAVYKDQFDHLFHPVLPVAEERMIIKGHGDTLAISPNCELRFFDTPGHANHHLSIFHPAVNGMFTGDTAGVAYPQLSEFGFSLFLPSTSPNQFDPEKMHDSLDFYESQQLNSLFFGHFASFGQPDEVYRQLRYWLPVFLTETEKVFNKYKTVAESAILELKKNLLAEVLASVAHLNIPEANDFYKILDLDLSVSAMGLLDYIAKK